MLNYEYDDRVIFGEQNNEFFTNGILILMYIFFTYIILNLYAYTVLT